MIAHCTDRFSEGEVNMVFSKFATGDIYLFPLHVAWNFLGSRSCGPSFNCLLNILNCIVVGTCFHRDNIRIYHECEGRIEKSVPRIAVWHHEACRVMTNGDPERQIFLSYPNTNNGFFFLLTNVFYLKISFQKSLNMLR